MRWQLRQGEGGTDAGGRYIQRQNRHGSVWMEASGVPGAESIEVRGWGTDAELGGPDGQTKYTVKLRDGMAGPSQTHMVSDSNSLRSHCSISMRVLTPRSQSRSRDYAKMFHTEADTAKCSRMAVIP